MNKNKILYLEILGIVLLVIGAALIAYWGQAGMIEDTVVAIRVLGLYVIYIYSH